jgi:hypothetical protein
VEENQKPDKHGLKSKGWEVVHEDSEVMENHREDGPSKEPEPKEDGSEVVMEIQGIPPGKGDLKEFGDKWAYAASSCH